MGSNPTVPTMTRVVHCKKEPFDVYIGRPSKWGNPFKIGRDGSRDEVIKKYEVYLFKSHLIDEIDELRDKTLGCWCSPEACHGDVLAKWANSPKGTIDQGPASSTSH